MSDLGADYVSELISSTPTGSDLASSADDHLRTIKRTLQNTFRNAGRPTVMGADTTGTSTAYQINCNPPVTEYVDGLIVRFRPHVDCDNGATLALDSLPPIPIVRPNGVTITHKDLIAGHGYECVYLSGYFQMFQLAGDPAWSPLTLQNGWTAYTGSGGGWTTPAYGKSAGSIILMKGIIAGGTTTYGTTITTLPEGYRPKTKSIFPVMSSPDGNTMQLGAVHILPTCEVQIYNCHNYYLSLENIIFYSEQ